MLRQLWVLVCGIHGRLRVSAIAGPCVEVSGIFLLIMLTVTNVLPGNCIEDVEAENICACCWLLLLPAFLAVQWSELFALLRSM